MTNNDEQQDDKGLDSGAEPEEYMRVAEVAKVFHVSPKTVSRWADEGRLPHIVTLGGHRRFPRKAVEALIPKLKEQ